MMYRKANWTWCWACPFLAALLVALLASTPAFAEFDLELGQVVEADARNDEMLFVINLDGPGLLTVFARPPQGQEGGQDLTLGLFDSEGSEINYVDSDTDGMLWNEMFTIQVYAGGEYVIEVGSIGTPGPVRVGASFISVPDLEGPVGKVLELGVGIADVVVGYNNYSIQIPPGDDGYLTVFTRGENGDIALEVHGRNGNVIANEDSDMGTLVNEAIFAPVEGGQEYTVRVRALQDNTAYSIYAHFIPQSALPEPGDVTNALIGTPFPNASLVSLDGSEVNISQCENRVVVVDFWASWCGPCREALPQLAEVQQFVLDEELPVSIYAVNVGEDQVTVQDFLEAEALELPVVLDQQDVLSTPLRVDAIPTTMILLDGAVHRVHVGATADYFDDIVDDILEALEAPPQVETTIDAVPAAESDF